jgi:3',5'-cyclic AMP phosphodiesterase CpdA
MAEFSDPGPLPPVTIGHLSDPHLTTLAGIKPFRLGPKRWLGYLSWRRKRRWHHRADVLGAVVDDLRAAAVHTTVVSGDLTHLGLPTECDQALAWLASLGPSASTVVIPGNHDRLVADDWTRTVGRWQPYFGLTPPVGSNADAVLPVADDPEHGFPFVRRHGSVALVGVNSSVPTRLLFADGRVGAAQRDALSAHLEHLAQLGAFRLVVMHHAPQPDGHSWRKRLRDARACVQVLAEAGAELVIHGHGHREVVSGIEGSVGLIPVIGAPSASLHGAAGWNHYTVAPTPDGWTLTCRARRLGAGGFSTRETRWGLPRAHAHHA